MVMTEQSFYDAPGLTPVIITPDQAPAQEAPRRPWDIVRPIVVTLAEAVRGTTRTLYFFQADGTLVTVPVRIPAGLSSGALLKIAGCGGVDPWGRSRGDLYVPVSLVPGQRLEWWGSDARLFLKLSSRELAEGAHVTIDQPGIGALALTVPPGTRDGTCLHWSGRGRGNPPGDLYVQLECLDPIPSIATAAASKTAPQKGRAWLWVALAMVVALVAIVALTLAAAVIAGR